VPEHAGQFGFNCGGNARLISQRRKVAGVACIIEHRRRAGGVLDAPSHYFRKCNGAVFAAIGPPAATSARRGRRRPEQLVLVQQGPFAHGAEMREEPLAEVREHVLDSRGRRRQDDAIHEVRALQLA
jgi:hypothetical protein